MSDITITAGDVSRFMDYAEESVEPISDFMEQLSEMMVKIAKALEPVIKEIAKAGRMINEHINDIIELLDALNKTLVVPNLISAFPGLWIDDALDKPETYDEMVNRLVFTRLDAVQHDNTSGFSYDSTYTDQCIVHGKKNFDFLHEYTLIAYGKTRMQDGVFSLYDGIITFILLDALPDFIPKIIHVFKLIFG